MNTTEEIKYIRAKEKVEAIKSFYSNLMAYCIVIPFLAWVNYNTTSFPWVVFPAVGWGIGLVGHWFQAYGYNPILGKGWEERKLREFMKEEEL